jgi:hypothetical protein
MSFRELERPRPPYTTVGTPVGAVRRTGGLVALGFYFTKKHLRRIRKEPHLIGHLIGFKDLRPIHSKWIKEAWVEGVKSVKDHPAMQCHRGSYKTSAITVVGAIWWLLFHPNDRIGLIRETWKVATSTLLTIKRGLKTPAIVALFAFAHGMQPKAVTDRADHVSYNFKARATNEGNIDAYGIDTVPTGTHYDIILCDDVISIKDRYSPAKREKTINNLREIITNIIDPGKPVSMVGTPWHKDDAWSELEKMGIIIKKYSVEKVGILSEEDLLEKLKTTTRSLWMANYYLEHTSDEDLLFQDPIFDTWEKGSSRVVAHIDAAYSGEDTIAFTLAARRPSDGKIQVRGWTFTGHIKQKLSFIKTMCRKYGAKKVYCENNNDQMEYLPEKLREKDGGIRGLNVESYSESMKKHQKIVSYISEYWNDIVFTDDTDDVYLSQVCDYVEGEEPDDAPDSLASILRAAFFSTAKSREYDIINQR